MSIPAPSGRIRSVCLFCGANVGTRAAYALAARELGTLLARQGLALVYGGGSVGLMNEAANAALAEGGSVIGVITEELMAREVGHDGLSRLHVVDTMHARKTLMADLADAFIALPGGYGTFDELCEMLTWNQLGIHAKPVVLVNLDGFFDGFLAQLDRAGPPAHAGESGDALRVRRGRGCDRSCAALAATGGGPEVVSGSGARAMSPA